MHRPHRGNPVQALKEELPKFLDGQPALVGITGALAGLVTDQLGARPVDLTQALMHAVGREAPDARAAGELGKLNLLDLGRIAVSRVVLGREQVAAAVGPRTRAIMLAHTLGNPWNIGAIMEYGATINHPSGAVIVIPPRPFLHPTMEKYRDQVIRNYREALASVLK